MKNDTETLTSFRQLAKAAADRNGMAVDEYIERLIVQYSAKIPNNCSGCAACLTMPCMCEGGRPDFTYRLLSGEHSLT